MRPQPLLVTPDVRRRALLVSKYHDDVKSAYYERRRSHADGALDSMIDTLVDATSWSSVVRRATIRHIDILRGNHNLLSSIDINATASAFATAGVAKRIKIFEFATVLDCAPAVPTTSTSGPFSLSRGAHSPADNSADGSGSGGSVSRGSSARRASPPRHYPILEVPTASKLSCLSWSKGSTSVLAAATYKGDILVHDTETNTQQMILREHAKRTWFVDYSAQKPSLLLSGSDDHSVKLWDTRAPTSCKTVKTGANVCCVKFNPGEANEFAFGSADHNVYLYDVRQLSAPLCVFEGHWRAVSHIVFLNRAELVSASIDSSCKLWNVVKQEPGLSYGGHTNGRNFVGLCSSNDFFACGSEDNAVYVYHKGFGGPVLRYAFDTGSGFVSTVAWKPDSNLLLAATECGNVDVVELK